MCFYYNDEIEDKKINTFLYQQDTNALNPGTLSPLPTQFFSVKQIQKQFIYNKYAYEISILKSKLKDVSIKENEKERLKSQLQEIQKYIDDEIKYAKKMFENAK